jgi:hypothetical protein
MRFVVRFLRYRGRILPGREVVNRPPAYGDLRIEEVRDEELRRYVRIASLYDTVSVLPSKATPELRDVRIVSMSPQAFSLSGSERIDGVEYVQSWLIAEKS